MRQAVAEELEAFRAVPENVYAPDFVPTVPIEPAPEPDPQPRDPWKSVEKKTKHIAKEALSLIRETGLAEDERRETRAQMIRWIDEGLPDVELSGDLRDGAFALLIGGNDSLAQI